MSKPDRVISLRPNNSHSRPAAYIGGFVLSLMLTLAAYWLTVHHTLPKTVLVGAVITLALIQFGVQLVFFLHLGQENRPRWRLWVFAFMVLVVAILVFGSLWIMQNLNYHMVSPSYMHNHEGL